jgi:integrase
MSKLTAAFVKHAGPGKHHDGKGLYLIAKDTGSRAWALRYERHGRERWMGLGSAEFVALAEAREKAFDARRLLRQGIDPLDARTAHEAARRAEEAQRRATDLKSVTFADCAQQYARVRAAESRSDRGSAKEWLSILRLYAFPVIGDVPAALIDTALVHRVLDPLSLEKPDRARRLRQQLEAVLDYAKVRGFRHGENPARLSGHLEHTVANLVRRQQHHPAMPYVELPAFMGELRHCASVPAYGLEFAILTAARAGEVRLAQWSEVDLAAGVWTIPADRMKAAREHRVPVSERAIAILSDLPRFGDFLFSGGRGGPMHENAMWLVLRELRPGLTVHGFRSTFRARSGRAIRAKSRSRPLRIQSAVPSSGPTGARTFLRSGGGSWRNGRPSAPCPLTRAMLSRSGLEALSRGGDNQRRPPHERERLRPGDREFTVILQASGDGEKYVRSWVDDCIAELRETVPEFDLDDPTNVIVSRTPIDIIGRLEAAGFKHPSRPWYCAKIIKTGCMIDYELKRGRVWRAVAYGLQLGRSIKELEVECEDRFVAAGRGTQRGGKTTQGEKRARIDYVARNQKIVANYNKERLKHSVKIASSNTGKLYKLHPRQILRIVAEASGPRKVGRPRRTRASPRFSSKKK